MSQRRFNRRDFVKYGVLAGATALLAREAVLQTSARDLARQADGSGVTAFGGGPGDSQRRFSDILGEITGSQADSQSLKDAYVQKKPTATQEILSALLTPFRLKRSDTSTLWEWNGATQRVQIGNIESESPTFFQVGDVISGQEFFPFAYSGGSKTWIFGDLESGDPVTNSKGIEFRANSSVAGGTSFGFTGASEQGSGALSSLFGAGAGVGLPTGTQGTMPNTLCLGGHRHAFSGRFSKGGFIRDASLGGATPAKFTRIISNNNWTVRRISIYALTAPAGTGSDTYGIVNAAGTLQGTAVSLAVGVQENATALQVTNLTGGTVYYIAVTARATTPALDVNVEVEYTMNV